MSDYSTHRYENIDRGKVDALLRALRQNGAAVSGDNPWEVDTHQSGVKLRGRLNEGASNLEVTVVDRDWYVPCSMVGRKIDELVHCARAMADVEI